MSRPLTGLGGRGYDVVIGDLFYSQLPYPVRLDALVSPCATRRALAECGPALGDTVVSRFDR